MKSASSFLYDALVRHPNILPALCGAQYKETNCYKHDMNAAEQQDHNTYATTNGNGNGRPSRLLQRSWCFPFIEPDEHFITVDGTIAYMIDPSIAKTIKEVLWHTPYPSICLLIHPSVYFSIHLSTYPSIHLYIHPSINSSICLSICLSINLM